MCHKCLIMGVCRLHDMQILWIHILTYISALSALSYLFRMNRPKGQQCLAKDIIDHTSLRWFTTNPTNFRSDFELFPFGKTSQTETDRHADRQYQILRLAQFKEPLPDNKVHTSKRLQPTPKQLQARSHGSCVRCET